MNIRDFKLHKSLLVGTFWGIPLRIHWSFALIFIYVAYIAATNDMGLQGGLWLGMLTTIIFLCVVLHEYGHATAARYYGISTRDIIVLPIGGVARLNALPAKPVQEIVVAIAGPLVNVLIALAIWPLLYFFTPTDPLPGSEATGYTIYESLTFILWANIYLMLFNMIPAFPMDGGRVLRGLLNIPFAKNKATFLALICSILICCAGLFYGIFVIQHPTLPFVALFIMFNAIAEYKAIKMEHVLKGTVIADLVNPSPKKLYVDNTFAEVFEQVGQNDDQNFLVFDRQEQGVGQLPSQFITDFKLQKFDPSYTIDQHFLPKFMVLPSNTTLESCIQTMQTEGLAIIGVGKPHELIGTLDRQVIEHYVTHQTKSLYGQFA